MEFSDFFILLPFPTYFITTDEQFLLYPDHKETFLLWLCPGLILILQA